MAIFLLAYKEMVTRINKLLTWIVPLPFEFLQLVSPMYHFNGNLMGSNYILAFSVVLLSFIFYNSLYKTICIKSHYSGLCIFSAIFENPTIVAYAGLRVKSFNGMFLHKATNCMVIRSCSDVVYPN